MNTDDSIDIESQHPLHQPIGKPTESTTMVPMLSICNRRRHKNHVPSAGDATTTAGCIKQEYESVLMTENDRLRKEVLDLRRKVLEMKESRHRQHQQHLRQQHQQMMVINPTKPNNNASYMNNKSTNRFNSSSNKKNNQIMLELPVTLRDHSLKGSIKKSQKDSISTTDEKETVEPKIDIDAHASAAGLHHRSTTNITARSKKVSSRSINDTAKVNNGMSSPFLSSRSESLTEYSSSTSDDNILSQDDPMGSEGLVLLNKTTTNGNDCHRNTTDSNNNNELQQQQMSFCQSLADRAGWLIGLLVFQSLSSFILARNEELLQHHGVIVQFLTMLVGAGGNAGNQASVGVVREIAVGTINSSNVHKVLRKEFATGVALSVILALAGFARAKVFAVQWMETFAITSSLFMIVFISVVVGATLPLCMYRVGIDPAHSSTTIQVIMDITGVIITVHISSFMLDSDFHDWLQVALSLDGETR